MAAKSMFNKVETGLCILVLNMGLLNILDFRKECIERKFIFHTHRNLLYFNYKDNYFVIYFMIYAILKNGIDAII